MNDSRLVRPMFSYFYRNCTTDTVRHRKHTLKAKRTNWSAQRICNNNNYEGRSASAHTEYFLFDSLACFCYPPFFLLDLYSSSPFPLSMANESANRMTGELQSLLPEVNKKSVLVIVNGVEK